MVKNENNFKQFQNIKSEILSVQELVDGGY